MAYNSKPKEIISSFLKIEILAIVIGVGVVCYAVIIEKTVASFTAFIGYFLIIVGFWIGYKKTNRRIRCSQCDEKLGLLKHSLKTTDGTRLCWNWYQKVHVDGVGQVIVKQGVLWSRKIVDRWKVQHKKIEKHKEYIIEPTKQECKEFLETLPENIVIEVPKVLKVVFTEDGNNIKM